MKRTLRLILCAIILISCLPISANASGGLLIQTNRINATNGKQTTESPDDIYVKDVVFYYYDSVGKVTFEEVKKYLDEKEYSYDASLGSDFSFCKIALDLEEGKITILFYPLDTSPNSTAFGDPAREYITLIQYDRGDDWLSIADGCHTTSNTMQAVYHAHGNNSFEFELVSDMVNFYNYNLGGAIIFDESMAFDIASVQKDNPNDAGIVGSDQEGNDPLTLTQEWKEKNGYDFPIYGSTSVDLSPISDYLYLLEENNILIKPQDISIHHFDDRDWIQAKIGESFWLYYLYYYDGSSVSFSIQVPSVYRPKDKAIVSLMVSFLSIDEKEAEEIYSTLQYNVIDEYCTIENDNYEIWYFEPRYSNGSLVGFESLDVGKKGK